MTDPQELLAQYRAGLDAELLLLSRLEALAVQQRDSTRRHDTGALAGVTEQRDRAMAALVAIEDDLRPLRRAIAADTVRFQQLPDFAEVAARHRSAADRVATILASDGESLAALREAEAARQLAARAIEQGESTLAAYRRVVAPAANSSTLVSRRG